MSQIRRNTIIYAIGGVLPNLGNFILLPVLTRYLTPSEYGTVNAMLLVSAIATIAFTLALDRSVWRLHHDYTAEERRELLGTLVVAIAVVATIGLVIAYAGRNLLQQVFPSIPFTPFYTYALLAAYFGVFSAIPKVNLQANGKAMTFVGLSVGQFVVTNTLVVWFVLSGQGPAGMLKGHMLGALASGAVFAVLSLKMVKLGLRKDMLVASLRFSAPLIPNLLFAWVLNLSDRVFLGRLRSLSEVGTYSAGYRLGGATTILTGAFYQAYNPVFYKLANDQDQVGARRTIARYNSTFLAVAICIGFAVAFLAPEAVALILPESYQGVTPIVQIVAAAYVVSQAQGLLELQIYQSKRTAGLMGVYGLGAAVNVALNVVFVPRYGAYAAAWATVVAFAVMFVADYFYARRGYFVPFQWPEVLPWVVVAAVLMVVGNQVPVSFMSFIGKAGITAVLFFAVERRYGVIGLRKMVGVDPGPPRLQSESD